MTKSTKHKKARKDNLLKVKLKVSKKLKKAQNETKTDFKARKIVMKEQLSVKPASSLVTKKNLNVTELLSRLSHHSVYLRQDGLNGLKELVIKNTKYELGPHLSTIFKGMNPCILDTDHLIRTTAVRVIESLITKIGNMIQPYFKFLVSHLSCAMVHLNTGVQSDSLLLMDVLLNHAPSLIALNANTILKNFFHLISRKMDSQSNMSNTLNRNYMLISNPSSKLASIKWRIKLLKSLGRYLESILGERCKVESSIHISTWQVITYGCLPPLVKEESRRTSIHGTNILTVESEARSFIESIVPLLFQTWSEIKENSCHDKLSSGTPLDPIAIELLRYITEIILQLWKITELVIQHKPNKCRWFMATLEKHMESDILEGFPYCAHETTKPGIKASSNGGKMPVDVNADCQNLNVSLASLAFNYMDHHLQLKKRIADYYSDLFLYGAKSTVDKLESVTTTACALLADESCLTLEQSCELLRASLHCYQTLKTSNKSRNALLKLPLQASHFNCKRLWTSSHLGNWMLQIVDDAVERPKEEALLEIMLQFKLRNTPGFAPILLARKDALKQRLSLKSEAKKEDITQQRFNVTVVI